MKYFKSLILIFALTFVFIVSANAKLTVDNKCETITEPDPNDDTHQNQVSYTQCKMYLNVPEGESIESGTLMWTTFSKDTKDHNLWFSLQDVIPNFTVYDSGYFAVNQVEVDPTDGGVGDINALINTDLNTLVFFKYTGSAKLNSGRYEFARTSLSSGEIYDLSFTGSLAHKYPSSSIQACSIKKVEMEHNIYFDRNGELTNIYEYLSSCNKTKCAALINDGYLSLYDASGEYISLPNWYNLTNEQKFAEWEKTCAKEYTCNEIPVYTYRDSFDNKYYVGKNNKVVSEEVYAKECLACKTINDKYYDKDGKLVDTIEKQNASCNPITEKELQDKINKYGNSILEGIAVYYILNGDFPETDDLKDIIKESYDGDLVCKDIKITDEGVLEVSKCYLPNYPVNDKLTYKYNLKKDLDEVIEELQKEDAKKEEEKKTEDSGFKSKETEENPKTGTYISLAVITLFLVAGVVGIIVSTKKSKVFTIK